MKQRFVILAMASLLSVGLASCQGEQPAQTVTAPAGPAEAIEQSAAQLKSGDLLAVIQAALPPEHFARAKTEWKANMQHDPASASDRAKFVETMQKLTGADAEDQLFAEVEPQIAQFEKEMAAQMPLMVGMGRGFAMQSVQASEYLTAEQKEQAGQLVDAVANWLQSAKFFDRELAKQAIGKVVASARALDVQTLEQVEAMEFEQAMQKAGIAIDGLFDVLAVYGLNVDETLASVDAEVLSQQDKAARVKVGYSVFGTPLSFETDMVQIGDRWYGKDAIAELERAEKAQTEVADDAAGEGMGDDMNDDAADADDSVPGDEAATDAASEVVE